MLEEETFRDSISAEDISDDYTMEDVTASNEDVYDEFTATFEKLEIPSFSATCSAIKTDIETTLTHVFSTPLIPGPVTDWSAVLTSLIRAAGVTEWACGKGRKCVISVDLDLYEKIYPLVNSIEELRGKYVICLGEMHAVFAHLRAIGNYISCSGIDDAWMESDWYQSECIVRQVVECQHMKRATDAHEATLIAVNILLLCLMINEYPGEFRTISIDLFTIVRMAKSALETNDFEELQQAFKHLETETVDFETKLKDMRDRKRGNMMFQLLMIYRAMVIRLFTFIETN